MAAGITLAGMNKERLDSVIEERSVPALSDAQSRELRARLEHHRAHPDEPTMTLAEIRKSLGAD